MERSRTTQHPSYQFEHPVPGSRSLCGPVLIVGCLGGEAVALEVTCGVLPTWTAAIQIWLNSTRDQLSQSGRSDFDGILESVHEYWKGVVLLPLVGYKMAVSVMKDGMHGLSMASRLAAEVKQLMIDGIDRDLIPYKCPCSEELVKLLLRFQSRRRFHGVICTLTAFCVHPLKAHLRSRPGLTWLTVSGIISCKNKKVKDRMDKESVENEKQLFQGADRAVMVMTAPYRDFLESGMKPDGIIFFGTEPSPSSDVDFKATITYSYS